MEFGEIAKFTTSIMKGVKKMIGRYHQLELIHDLAEDIRDLSETLEDDSKVPDVIGNLANSIRTMIEDEDPDDESFDPDKRVE